MTLPTGRLEDGGYDEAGNLYKIPEAVLSDPTNIIGDESDVDGKTVVGVTEGKALEKSGEETMLSSNMAALLAPAAHDKGKAAVEKDAMKIKCRLSDRGGPDIVVLLGKSQTVGVLAKRIKDEAEACPWQPANQVLALTFSAAPNIGSNTPCISWSYAR